MATTSRKTKSNRKVEDGFVEGAIKSIRLSDFLTYDTVEIRPGPHLNMIIGPNTSGKSSIVCAICLGLAGKTSFLARAPQPVEFIKHGCEKATIEIVLYNPGDANYVIKRVISRTNKSDWFLGGRACTQKAVEELVGNLNIQVGNLCQFLPQDKVAEFAKMSQQELLENTEKAVGPPDMFVNHQRLQTARVEARNFEQSVKSKREFLEQERQKNERLEADVKNHQQRQKHLARIKILRMKKPWVEYEEKRKKWVADNELKAKMKADVQAARTEHAPLQAKLDKANTNKEMVHYTMTKEWEQVKDLVKQVASKTKDIENLNTNIENLDDELKEKKTQESKRRRKVADLNQHLETLEEDLKNLDDQENVQPLIEKCKQQLMKTNQEMTAASQKGEGIKAEVNSIKREINNLQNALQRVKDVSNQRLAMLRNKHKDTYDAVQWLRANQHRFKGKIHEPLMLVINMKNQIHAKYIESHVSFNDMRVFVCEDGNDMELFLKTMRDEQRLKVNAALKPKEDPSEFRPRFPINNLSAGGFHSYMKDLFECPDAVMAYLCKLYRVHLVPIGTQYTKDNVQTVIRQWPELNSFYTDAHNYSIKRSKYGNRNVSTRCTELKNAQLLTVTMDISRERALEEQLQQKQELRAGREEEYRNLQQTHRTLETTMNTLRQEKKSLMERKDRKRSLQQKINMKKDSIARYEEDAIDIEQEELKVKKKVESITFRKVKLVKEISKLTSKCLKHSLLKVRLSLQHAMALKEMSIMQETMRDKSQALASIEREYKDLEVRVKTIKEEARCLLREAKEATNTGPQEELSKELREAFETLPSVLEDIQAMIHEEQARADCTFHTDDSVVDEYNKRKKDIVRYQAEIGQREEAQKRHQEEIEDIKTRWIDPLQELISKINKNFSSFFKSMQCAGEVDLHVPENPEDYEKYGMRIKVKYRDTEPLRELTTHHQSGGERSVATVLYMMSLQELTKCPFRCVDEINQGMDAQNERKVFELVVKTANREGTSQYFLLTPKLLPNLDYSDRMTVLCVFNGPYMLSHSQWSLTKYLRLRAQVED